MKLKSLMIAIAMFALISASSSQLQAQMATSPAMDAFSGAMMQLFGKNQHFKGTVTVQMEDKSTGPSKMKMNMAMSEGKGWTEMDLSTMESPHMTPEAVAHMKQMGMDKSINISLPEKKVVYMIYPSVKGYTEMPLTSEQTDSLANPPKIEKTELGKETVDGHPCIKNKLTFIDSKGQKQEMIVWNATDLKDFPIQSQLDVSGSKILSKYQNLSFEKPDAKLFEVPQGYQKYSSMQELMMSQMRKHMPQ